MITDRIKYILKNQKYKKVSEVIYKLGDEIGDIEILEFENVIGFNGKVHYQNSKKEQIVCSVLEFYLMLNNQPQFGDTLIVETTSKETRFAPNPLA